MAYGSSLFRLMAEKQVVAPYVQAVMLNPIWPDNFTVPDPYYHDSHDDDYFHPSTHAIYGDRALYEMLHPDRRKLLQPRKETFEGILTPMMGTMMHNIIQQKMILAGLVKPDDVEISLVDEDRHWRGHADLRFAGELIDIKTMNSFSFGRFSKAYTSWVYQLHPYMDRLGLDKSLVLIVEMGRPWGLKEVRVLKEQRILDEIYSKWERVRKAIANNEPPQTCCLPGYGKYCPIKCSWEGKH